MYGYYAATKDVNGEKDPKCKGLDILQIKDLDLTERHCYRDFFLLLILSRLSAI